MGDLLISALPILANCSYDALPMPLFMAALPPTFFCLGVLSTKEEVGGCWGWEVMELTIFQLFSFMRWLKRALMLVRGTSGDLSRISLIFWLIFCVWNSLGIWEKEDSFYEEYCLSKV